MTDEQLKVCQLCLSLCRDVCPVAVHSFRDDLLPNHKVRAAVLVLEGGSASLEQLDACTDCGACTSYCHFDVPVADYLARARERVQPPPTPRLAPAPARQLRAADLPGALRMACCDHDAPELDLPVVEPPLGSSSCGATLPDGVGDPELHVAMARAMLVDVADGGVVVVADPGCAAHLHASAAGRVKVVVAAADE